MLTETRGRVRVKVGRCLDTEETAVVIFDRGAAAIGFRKPDRDRGGIHPEPKDGALR